MQKIKTAVCVAACTLFSGCASITKDINQPIKVETYVDGQMLEGAKCMAKNDRGETSVVTPGHIVLHRSGANLSINCEKDGITGSATLISRANGGMFGNILFGGGIGAIIDHNRGSAYSYPDWIRVIMGENLMFDRKNSKDNEVMLGQPASDDEIKKIEQAKLGEEKMAEEASKKAQEAAK